MQFISLLDDLRDSYNREFEYIVRLNTLYNDFLSDFLQAQEEWQRATAEGEQYRRRYDLCIYCDLRTHQEYRQGRMFRLEQARRLRCLPHTRILITRRFNSSSF